MSNTSTFSESSNSQSETIAIVVVDNRQKPPPPTNYTDLIMESVALSGIAVSEQPSMLSNLTYSNTVVNNDLSAKGSVSNGDAQNKLRISILAKAIDRVQNPQPMEARCSVDVLTNNELAQAIADLKSVVSAFS